MRKRFKLFAWQRLPGRAGGKALCLALASALLVQGCTAPIAGERRQPRRTEAGLSTSGTGAPGTGGAPDLSAPAARARILGELEPAPDLEGRPLSVAPGGGASADARSVAGGKATSEAKRAAESWLGQYGTARLDLLGSFHGGALDMLLPIHDSGIGLIFSQFGVRRTNLLQEAYRTTVNLGLGYRHFGDGYMAGGNAFLDQDVSRGHRRLGLGAEWWADYLKLGLNGYFRLSDWKRSPDARDYQERPANGWDVRTEGYLPQYPQLGGKLMFEKYYGDEVGLFGASNRQRNPSAWTLGVSYTPAPAVTLGLDHRMGQGGKSDTSFKLGLKYAIGVPLAKQMRSGEVASSRKLAGMRMDLVERNNEIVLEYKKNDPITIQLPASASGYPQTVIGFPVTLAGAGVAPRIEWSGSAAAFAMPYGGGAAGSMKLPDYRSDGANSYQLMATATDAHGRKIRSNVMNVSVDPLSVSVARSKATAIADGVDSVRFTAQVRGVQAEAMAGRAVAWALKGAGAITQSSDRTDADGMAYAVVSSKVAAVIGIEATESLGFKGASEAEFLDDHNTVGVTQLDAAPAAILANGKDKAVLKATVKDGKGNAAGAGVAVTWTATGGQLAGLASNTDENGVAVMELLSATVPGAAVVTAKTGPADPGKTRSVELLLDTSDAKVVLLAPSKTTALAGGIDTVTLTATVTDGRGNPVGAGVAVNWSASLGELSAAASGTDANSQATVVLTAPAVVGTALVTATAAKGDAGKTVSVGFAVDAQRARVAALTSSKTSGLADGADTVTLTATVDDGRGNPVGAGVAVNWSASLGTLGGTASNTDANSQATVVLTAPAAVGTATVTARGASGDAGKTAAIPFVADAASARVVSLVPGEASGVANGTDGVVLTATVEDGSGNRVGAGVAVNWTATLGAIATTSVTDASGQATALLIAPVAPGTAIITATAAKGDAGKTVSVGFAVDVQKARVTELTPSKTSGLANGADTVTLTAMVADAWGNPVGAGVAVNWSASLGSLGAAVSKTDGNSQATVVLTSPAGVGRAAVTAHASDGDAGKTVTIAYTADLSSARVVAGAYSGNKSPVLANGVDVITLWAYVKDATGNRVAGATVDWTTNLGTLDSVTSLSDANGEAHVMLVSTIAGDPVATARVGAADPGRTIGMPSFEPDPSTARVVELTPSKASGVANGVDTVSFTAVLKDRYDNLMWKYAAVNWTTSGGVLAAAVSETDAGGKATMLLSAPKVAGRVDVTAKGAAADAGKTASVTFSGGASSSRVGSASASKTSILANGRDTVILTATVLDGDGNAAGEGLVVDWNTSLGMLDGPASRTNANGVATAVLTAGKVAGVAAVTAKAGAGDAGGAIRVTLTADPMSARVASLSSSKAKGVANGRDSLTLTATVHDVNGNLEGAGVAVNWRTNLGSLAASSSSTDARGVATVMLRAPASAGVAVLTARAAAADGGKTIRVGFEQGNVGPPQP